MEDHRRLEVYQLARKYSVDVYRAVLPFPQYLRWGLGAQLNNATESIGSNIAEGCARKNSLQSNAELIRYLHFALASTAEAQHRVTGANDKELIPDAVYENLEAQVETIKGKLIRLIVHLQRNDRTRKRRWRSD